MATRSVLLWPDAALTQMCVPVDLADPTLPALIQDLFDTMYDANGRGLAAPQIGVLQRIFVVDVRWKEGTHDPCVFINPQINPSAGSQSGMDEQCLSIPDLPMAVQRPDAVALTWQNRDGSKSFGTFDGILARCIQHEFDHLNGTVIFDHQTPETRAALEVRYAS